MTPGEENACRDKSSNKHGAQQEGQDSRVGFLCIYNKYYCGLKRVKQTLALKGYKDTFFFAMCVCICVCLCVYVRVCACKTCRYYY
jgi:hypothetical protein